MQFSCSDKFKHALILVQIPFVNEFVFNEKQKNHLQERF